MTRSLFAIFLFLAAPAFAQPAPFPTPVEADFVARDFVFNSGERMVEVKIHYRTVGTPRTVTSRPRSADIRRITANC